MTDVSVCQTQGFQAVWRFLRPFRNLQIMTHLHNRFVVALLWCALLFPILILIIAVTMTRMTKIKNGVS
jgi:hypothetical protein